MNHALQDLLSTSIDIPCAAPFCSALCQATIARLSYMTEHAAAFWAEDHWSIDALIHMLNVFNGLHGSKDARKSPFFFFFESNGQIGE